MPNPITRHRKKADDRLALGLASGHGSQRNSEQQQEIREARRFLKKRVRCDWEFPIVPKGRVGSAVSSGPKEGVYGNGHVDGGQGAAEGDLVEGVSHEFAGFVVREVENEDEENIMVIDTEEPEFEPMEWRDRVYSSDEPLEEDETAARSQNESSKEKVYKFEDPDSVGTQLSNRSLARKRKRQDLLEEEVQYNEGLVHWLTRRNVWCGARTPSQISALKSSKVDSAANTSSESVTSTPRTSTSSNLEDTTPRSSAATTPDLKPETSTIPLSQQTVAEEMLVPVAPPMLPNHPVRRKITPETYPEIYSKIIVQSRSPSVPINLQVMTRALVRGWKEDGEWPPKQNPIEKAIGRKKTKGTGDSSLKSSVKAVGRVLKITGSGEEGKEV